MNELIGTTETINVESPGNYVLQAMGTNGCTDEFELEITQDITSPIANPNVEGILNCDNSTVNLQIGGSSSGDNFNYQWQNENGEIIGSGDNFPVSNPGTYTLIVSNLMTGCEASMATQINENFIAPTALIENPAPLTCQDESVVLDGSISSGLGDLTYQWFNSDNDIIGNEATVAVNEAATYQLVVTSSENGCTASESVTVVEAINLPTAVINFSGALTCENNEIILNASESSTGLNFQYQWFFNDNSLSENSQSLTVSNAGEYTLQVTNLDNGCTASAVQNIEQNNDLPIATIDFPATLNCQNATILLDGNNSSQGENFSYQWQFNNQLLPENTPALSVEAPGEYQLIVTNNETGCTSSSSQLVEQNLTAPVATLPSANILNCGETPVLMEVDVEIQNNYSYQWNFNNQPMGNENIQQASSPGIYEVVITDYNNFCTTVLNQTVTQDIEPPLAEIAIPELLTCTNTSVFLSANQGANVEYQWVFENEILDNNNSELQISEPGLYELTVTNIENACTATVQQEVSQNIVNPIAQISPVEELNCNNASILIDATGSSEGGNIEYQWTFENEALAENDISFEASNAGNYALIVTDSNNGCTALAMVEVTQDPNLPYVSINAPQQLTCDNESVTLDASNSSSGTAFQYQWMLGDELLDDTSPIINVTLAGEYSLVITNVDNGCIASSSQIVSQNLDTPIASINLEQELNCNNQEFILDIGNSSTGDNIQYEWFFNNEVLDNGVALNTTTSGEFTLVVTNTASGCTSSSSIQVNEDIEAPAISMSTPEDLNCNNNSTILEIEVNNSSNNIDYQWFFNGNSIQEDESFVTVDIAGSYEVIVTNLDNGCSSTLSQTVTENLVAPTATIVDEPPLDCNNTSLLLDGTASSQGANFEYQWQLNGEVLPDSGLEITVSTPGTYTLLVNNTDNGCSASYSQTVTQNPDVPTAIIQLPNQLDCNHPFIILDAAESSTGSNFQYEWSLDNEPIEQNTLTFETNNPGNYTLVVTNTENGCSANYSQNVVANFEYPIANAGDDLTLPCNYPTLDIQLDGTASSIGAQFEYLWESDFGVFDGATDVLNPTITNAGNYQLIVSNTENGCSAIDEIMVFNDVGIQNFNFESENPSCYNAMDASIQIQEIVGGTGPYQIAINDGPYTEEFAYYNLGADIYEINILDSNGCEFSNTAILENPDSLFINLPDTIVTSSRKPFALFPTTNLQDTEIESILWSPSEGLDCENCLITEGQIIESTIFNIEVTSINGCMITDQVHVLVDDQIQVWEFISPYTQDGKNDDWTIDGIDQYGNNEVLIFNRWGDIVYEAKPYSNDNPWDGRNTNGKLLPEATYYFLIRYDIGQTKILKGRIAIVR